MRASEVLPLHSTHLIQWEGTGRNGLLPDIEIFNAQQSLRSPWHSMNFCTVVLGPSLECKQVRIANWVNYQLESWNKEEVGCCSVSV